MNPQLVIADSSALIALAQIGRMEVLRDLFGPITIPPAVRQETARSVPRLDWILEQPLLQPVRQELIDAKLGLGEREAIELALTFDTRWLILDERRAFRIAGALGIPVTGTIGVLVRAKEAGLPVEVRARWTPSPPPGSSSHRRSIHVP